MRQLSTTIIRNILCQAFVLMPCNGQWNECVFVRSLHRSSFFFYILCVCFSTHFSWLLNKIISKQNFIRISKQIEKGSINFVHLRKSMTSHFMPLTNDIVCFFLICPFNFLANRFFPVVHSKCYSFGVKFFFVLHFIWSKSLVFVYLYSVELYEQ